MRLRASHLLIWATCLVGCAHAPRPAVLDQSKLTAESDSISSARRLAPQAYAHAEALRLKAEEALSDGSALRSEALAERSLVAFQRAAVQARKIETTERIASAEQAMRQRRVEIAKLVSLQEAIARETKQLELRVEVETNALPRPALTPEAGRRGEARAEAARSIAEAARLLCAAARLLDPKSEDAALTARKTETLLENLPSLAPHEALTQAMDQRVACLSVLTQSKRATNRTSHDAGDQFLATLSPAFGDLRPHRDDRGVVLTAVGAWDASGLTKSGQDVVDRIGGLSASNTFPVLVVLHSASKSGSPNSSSAAAKLQQAFPSASVIVAESPLPALVELPAAARLSPRIEFIFVTP